MSGENMAPTQEKGGNQNTSADVFADMPSFEEHIKQLKSFNQAKLDGELPDGIRDEQDYQEYLAEQESRRREVEKQNHDEAREEEDAIEQATDVMEQGEKSGKPEVFERIDQIRDPYDKDLAAVCLSWLYPQKFDYSTIRDDDTRAMMVKEHELDTKLLEGIVDYIESDEQNKLISDCLAEQAANARDNGDIELQSRALELLRAPIMVAIEVGNSMNRGESIINNVSNEPDEKNYNKFLFLRDRGYSLLDHGSREID